MAKPPDSKKARDPARPTRAKAAREPLAPIAPALEKLLNPGIAKGTAGVGSQTGLNNAEKSAKRANAPLPGGDGWTEKGPKTGLQPPADNSWDRREDFSAAHRARKSVSSPLLGPKVSEPIQKAPTTSTSLPNPPLQGGREHTESGEGASRPTGFGEAQQAKYNSDAELIEASPELARALGLDGDSVSFPEPEFQRPKPERRRPERGDISSMGVAATAQSLENLLREGRAEFKGAIAWTPHRPARPEKSEGGRRGSSVRRPTGTRTARGW